MSGVIRIAADQLSALVARLFVAAGIPDTAAITVARALVDADLEGQSSHGVMLVEMYLDRIRKGSVSLKQAGEIVSDKGASVVLDAHHALGHLTGDQAIKIAIERARRFGAGLVAVRHAFHFGTARRFALKAADEDCIRNRHVQHATADAGAGRGRASGRKQSDRHRRAVEWPGADRARHGHERSRDGQDPHGREGGGEDPGTWAVKADGSATTDPAEAIAGMLLPASGPKGFGLAFLIDLLCGVLSGGATGSAVQPLYGNASTPYDSSHLFIAIDIAHFGDRAAMRAAATAAAERIRAGAHAPGAARLFTPGEPEWVKRESAAGQVMLPGAVADTLLRLRKGIAGACRRSDAI